MAHHRARVNTRHALSAAPPEAWPRALLPGQNGLAVIKALKKTVFSALLDSEKIISEPETKSEPQKIFHAIKPLWLRMQP